MKLAPAVREVPLVHAPRALLARLSATQLFVASFAGLIAVGTLGLLVLPGLYTGERLGFVDALFTATSAVCVTGLIVVDTATYFTPLGQAWIALLIQLGGLGILTLTTLLIRMLGGRARLHVEEAAGGGAAVLEHLEPRALLRAVVTLTLTVEAAGAALLWLLWRDDLGSAAAVWPAIFHAISAFCNAGFSIFSTSLVSFRESIGAVVTISLLIITGGLGFIVLEDLRCRYVSSSTRRLAAHTRLALAATIALLAGGTFLYFVFELPFTLRELSGLDRLTNAWFMSVTARTAGFNTVDYNSLSDPALFLTVLLMIVGGSPGSTAGGLKTTTVALLGLSFLARMRGERHLSLFDRTVPDETVYRA
ncbi:MAG: potassium transporter TrkH, partial [Gemmatimonadetes bacterium]|nr:potassium transporter TrkH [Gemmatimonadota bacterium]